jgi:hypothetical protein
VHCHADVRARFISYVVKLSDYGTVIPAFNVIMAIEIGMEDRVYWGVFSFAKIVDADIFDDLV